MTAPDVRVYIGFGSTWQTEPASITWTDVTEWVLHSGRVKTRRGASSARGRVDVGRCELVLKNTDRRFDPLHTAGPYYGSLLPGVPVWVFSDSSAYSDTYSDTYGSGFASVFRGTVARWPQRFDKSNRVAWVPLEGYDGFDKLARAKIPQAVYPQEVAETVPSAYWRLDESTGTVMVDSSGNGLDGLYDNATIGEEPLIVDGNGKSVFFEHVGDNRGQYIGESLPVEAPVSIEAWVKLERDLTETHNIVTVQRDAALGSGLILNVETSSNGSPNGELCVNFSGLGGSYKARGSTRIDDGEVHHVVMTMASTTAADIKLYVDGALETKTLISGTTGGTWLGHFWWVVGNVAASPVFDFGFAGHVDEVAVYPDVLTAGEVLAHFTAGSTALAGQSSDERITYILDQLDWPANLRDLETGQTLLGAATFQAGDEALTYLRQVAQSEDGLLFITADGTLRFLDRYWRFLDSAATTSQFTFTDDDTSNGYAEFDLDIDDELLVNVARVTRRGGAERVASNDTSVAAHGQAEVQLNDLLLRTDVESQSLAEWIVATRGSPLPRVPNIRVPLHRYSAADQATVLGLELGERVSVVRTPSVGSAIELDLVIDGVENDVGGGEWWWTAFVSPVPEETLTPFIWGTSSWGGTDAWAY